MTEEEKRLLFIDLCERLPYGVKVDFSNTECILSNIGSDGSVSLLKSDKKAIYATNIQYIKPYLRPMSSMTEEEENEYYALEELSRKKSNHGIDILDWLLFHHFDFRDLIGKGLALEKCKESKITYYESQPQNVGLK